VLLLEFYLVQSLFLLSFSPNWFNHLVDSRFNNFNLKVYCNSLWLVHFGSIFRVFWHLGFRIMNYYFVMCVKIECVEIEYLTLQYWATSASVFSVLLFLALTIRHSHWGVRFSFAFVLSQAVLCVAVLLTTSQIGKFCFGLLNHIPILMLNTAHVWINNLICSL